MKTQVSLSLSQQWTLDLCRKDSDGDGLHNGLELGDPYCTWKENNPPLTKEGISHPGKSDQLRF